MGGGLAARVASFIVILVSTPVVFRYLGVERFGVWAVMMSLVGVLTFTDFGVGSGLVNYVTLAIAHGDHATARRFVSTSVLLLSVLAIALGVFLAAVYPHVQWASLLGVSSVSEVNDVDESLIVLAACVLVGFPLSVAQKVQFASQEGFAAGIWLAVGSVMGLVGLVAAIAAGAGLPGLMVAMLGGPVFAAALQSWIVFGSQKPWLRPSIRIVDARTARRLLGTGSQFFVLQIASILSYQIDVLVIARIRGPAEVAGYAIPARLFAVVTTVVAVAAIALWPAYGDAIASRDLAWVVRTLRRSLWFSLIVSALGSAVLLVFGKWIVSVWVGPTARPSTQMLVALSAFTVASGLAGSLGMFMTGANRMKIQVVLGVATATVNVGLSVWLTTRIGAPGAVWGSACALVGLVLIPLSVYVPRFLSDLRVEWQEEDGDPDTAVV